MKHQNGGTGVLVVMCATILLITSACGSKLREGVYSVEHIDESWSCDVGELVNARKSLYDPSNSQFYVERSGLRELHFMLFRLSSGDSITFDCKPGSHDTFSCDPIEQAGPFCFDTGDTHGDLIDTYTLSGEITSRTTFIGTLTDHSEWVGDAADDPGCNQCLVSYTFDATKYADL